MSRITIGLLFCLALCPLAAAQEQRGSIEGLVKDSSGAVVPGATVEARSPALVGVSAAFTDTLGVYRFPSLAPGVYEITATLQGFGPGKTSGVRLELGQVLKVDLVLAVAGVTEDVQVRAEAPIIDVKQNTAGTNVQAEVIDRIPKGRDYTTLITSAPGIDNESRNRGIQIDGASGADNRFFIDGVDQTDLRVGTSLAINSSTNTAGKAVANDFVEQVQVKSSGYNAEHRAAIGGVITAITKTGSNQWHGSAGGYFTSNGLQGRVRPTLQLNPSNQREAQYIKAPPDTFKDSDSSCASASGTRTAGRSTAATCSADCSGTGRASRARTRRLAACSPTRASRSTSCTTRSTPPAGRATACSAPIARTSSSCRPPTICPGARSSASTISRRAA